MPKPIVGIPCNRVEYQAASSHLVKHQYIRPLLEIVDCIPLLIPAIGTSFDLKSLLGKIDGLLLTGATSNVCPTRYGAQREFSEDRLDIDRDDTNFSLIRSAIDLDFPLFAICRGFQELNVACGGTLHQYVHQQPGKTDHRSDYSLSVQEQFERQHHIVQTQRGGLFEKWRLPDRFSTNSLHEQGIDKLGANLVAEAISDDGLIEAISLPHKHFTLGVQWHPEGDFWLNESSVMLFKAFREALQP